MEVQGENVLCLNFIMAIVNKLRQHKVEKSFGAEKNFNSNVLVTYGTTYSLLPKTLGFGTGKNYGAKSNTSLNS